MSRKSSKEGTFGAPKPLPGQSGYKVSESDLLEKDAREMEMRLQLLQEKMRQQNEELEKNQQRNGGSKWKNAKPEKGSIRQYGSEIREKAKGRVDNTLLLTGKPSASNLTNTLMSSTAPVESSYATSTDRLTPSPTLPHIVPSATASAVAPSSSASLPTDLRMWSKDEVGLWLTSLGLSQYIAPFRQNEIDGPTLLDLTLEDLDYLHVTVLAHRKVLFREIESMRKKYGHTPAPSLPPSHLPPLPPTQPPADASKKTHWSHLEPLASQPVQGGGRGVAVNLADEPAAGDLDEEEERRAFQQAVAEWRGDGGAVKIVRENEGMWVNPFAAPAAEKPAVAGGGVGGGGLLMDGDLDEEHEREEFKKAVESWRRSQAQPQSQAPPAASSSSSSSASASAQGEGVGVGVGVGAGEGGLRGAKALALSLAEDLERERQEREKQLEKARRDAERKLKLLKEQPALPAPSSLAFDDEDDEGEGAERESAPYSPPSSHRAYSSPRGGGVVSREDEGVGEEKRWHDAEASAEASAAPASPSVRICLVESVLGSMGGGGGSEEGVVIEYGSDDD